MSIFKEYEDSFERDVDILLREHDINFSRLMTEYAYDVAMIDEDLSFMSESEGEQTEKKPSGFIEFIRKAVDYIVKLISDFLEMLGNFFNTKEHITTSDYLGSETGKLQLEYDMERVQKEVDAQMLEGRKLVQLISKGTHIPAEKIAAFSDKCARVCKDHGKVIVGTAAALAISKGIRSHMKKTKNSAQEIGKDAEKCAGDAEKETAMRKIFNAVDKMISEYVNASSIVSRNIQKEAKKNRKNK